MNELATHPAKADDLDAIIGLLKENDLHPASVEKFVDDFLVLKEGDQIIGCGGYEIYGETALLRSVAIRKNIQSKGLGTRILKDLFTLANSRKVKRIFLLTTTAPDFFARFGFRQIHRDDVDEAIKATEEYTSICPASSIVMKLELD